MIPIKSWLDCTFLDWPGKLASVIFLPGCNFRCLFCHNHPLVSDPESLADISLETVLLKSREKSGWIDGIVVSGGEPTIHPFLPELLEEIRAGGFGVKLDTNGSNPRMLEDVFQKGLLDAVAMDIKAPLDDGYYRRLAGVEVDTALIRRSIGVISSSGVPHTFRTTVVPGYLMDEDLLAITRELPPGEQLVLQGFQPFNVSDPALSKAEAHTEEDLSAMVKLSDKLVARPLRQPLRPSHFI